LRQILKQNDEKYSWIIFDGEVKIEWIENLSSCLDESKKFTLVSGE
jgi:dynein heavy chain 1